MARILHLSDLHFCKDKKFCHFAEQSPADVAKSVVESLSGNPPDYVVVSGDLTWSGDIAEFTLAQQYLNTLIQGLGLNRKKHLLVVPGNHDLRWKVNGKKAIGEEREAPFRSFHENFIGVVKPGIVTSLVDNTVTMIGMNSASSESKDHPGLSIVDVEALQKAIKAARNRRSYNPDAPKLAVFHHHILPVAWLEPDMEDKRFGLALDSEAVQTVLIEEGFHAVLHGHQHQPFFRTISNPTIKSSPDRVLVVSGCGSFGVAQSRLAASRRNHFQLVDISPSAVSVKWFELSHNRPDKFESTKVIRYPSQRPRKSRGRLLVGVSGSLSVGKTTLVQGIKAYLEKHFPDLSVYVVGEVARRLITRGVSADEQTTFNDYAKYLCEHLSCMNNVGHGIHLFDRTLLDTLAYAEQNGNMPPEWLAMVREIARLCSGLFDHYIYVPIEKNVPLKKDGLRSIDGSYRKKLDDRIRNVLTTYKGGFQTLSGDIEKRQRDAIRAIIDRAQHIID